MKGIGKWVVKLRHVILIAAVVLLIPSGIGYLNTRINYDVLTYLPKDIETMVGQDILLDEFGQGAVSMVVVRGMEFKDVASLKAEIEEVPHVKDVIWYDSFVSLSTPVEMLPQDVRDAFLHGDATLMAVTYDTGTSADETMDAITEIRKLATENVYLAGISGIVTDTRDLANAEEPIYVLLAVIFATIILGISMDTFLAPIFFLLSIGMCIIYNLGSNWFFGEISYITKALAAVLQLGVTMDYSIFLWHSFKEKQQTFPGDSKSAMAAAINMTLQSVIGSSITTIAGFIALCFMSFTLGLDIGVVMAKGVILGVIVCVTMDYSIFLWHSFKEKQQTFPGDSKSAMAAAINMTLQSVIGSSITTIAGFIALCFMSFTLGLDIGVVMAKGVIFGVIGCVTILPSMILTFEKAIEKTAHKPLLPKFEKIPAFIQRHYKAVLVLFVLIWIPAVWGYTHTSVYYKLDDTLPKDLPSVVSNRVLDEDFHMGATHMILVDSDIESSKVSAMCDEMRKVDGVKSIIGLDALLGPGIPREVLPEKITSALVSEDWELMLINSEYPTASDEVNRQVTELGSILHRYDKNGMLIGEAPCTLDLIRITDHDFRVVNWASIGLIFIIIFFVFKSLSLPVLLVLVIEFAIFINMGIPGFTGTKLPFVASVVIGTIQLGSTVDYAILMTSRYQTERAAGKTKEEAVMIAHRTSFTSIIVSAFSFFAATFGVGLYSNISMISSLCLLMARGAMISMATVLIVLPSVLLFMDPVIVRTSIGFLPESLKKHNGSKHKADPQPQG